MNRDNENMKYLRSISKEKLLKAINHEIDKRKDDVDALLHIAMFTAIESRNDVIHLSREQRAEVHMDVLELITYVRDNTESSFERAECKFLLDRYKLLMQDLSNLMFVYKEATHDDDFAAGTDET